MSHQLWLACRHKHLAFLIAAMGALGLLCPFHLSAQVVWTVTIAFTTTTSSTGAPVDHETYTVARNPATGGTCNYSVPDDGGYHLRVCSGDKIYWVVTTPGSQNAVRIFLIHAVLDDANSMPTHLFQAQNAALTGGPVDSNVKPSDFEEYEYSVAAYDINNQHLYLHEPRIIIGTGGKGSSQEILKVLEGIADRLKRSLEGSSLDTEAVKDDLKKLDAVIADLKKQLNVQ